jgi:antitoxin VapB
MAHICGYGAFSPDMGHIWRYEPQPRVTSVLAYTLEYVTRRPGGVVRTERIVRLFRNGRNQAVRIPRDFEFPGSEALVRKEGSRLVVEPIPRPNLLELLATWTPLGEDFPDIDDLEPIEEVTSKDAG